MTDETRYTLARFVQRVERGEDIPLAEQTRTALAIRDSHRVVGDGKEPGRPEETARREELFFFLHGALASEGRSDRDAIRRDQLIDEIAPRLEFDPETVKGWYEKSRYSKERLAFRERYKADPRRFFEEFAALLTQMAVAIEIRRLLGEIDQQHFDDALATIVSNLNQIEPELSHYGKLEDKNPISSILITLLEHGPNLHMERNKL